MSHNPFVDNKPIILIRIQGSLTSEFSENGARTIEQKMHLSYRLATFSYIYADPYKPPNCNVNKTVYLLTYSNSNKWQMSGWLPLFIIHYSAVMTAIIITHYHYSILEPSFFVQLSNRTICRCRVNISGVFIGLFTAHSCQSNPTGWSFRCALIWFWVYDVGRARGAEIQINDVM